MKRDNGYKQDISRAMKDFEDRLAQVQAQLFDIINAISMINDKLEEHEDRIFELEPEDFEGEEEDILRELYSSWESDIYE